MLTKQNLLIGGGVVVLIVVLTLSWMFGDIIRDTVVAWQKSSSSQEVLEARQAEAASKAIAEEALKDLAETKDRLNKQILITDKAEAQLFDSHKISEKEKQAYEQDRDKILNSEYRSTNPALNTDELCARAKSLGISCE